MRSIERKFREFEGEYPFLSSYMIFARTVTGQHFSRDRLMRYFNKLVDPEDYNESDKKALVINLIKLTNDPETYEKRKARLKIPLFVATQEST